ncbi:MAG TPA: hypothetical protein VF406_09635 [Thermodesulfobacteriota bacterium]
MTDERRTDRDGTLGEEVLPEDRALAAALRARASRPPAPPALRARIEAALAAEVAALGRGGPRRGEAPAPRWRVAAPAVAAAVAGLVLAAVSAVTWMALPGAERRLAADAVREALAAYERLEARGPTAPADDAVELSRRLTDALGVPVRIATPPGGRIRSRGTAPVTLFGRDGMAVFFEADGETVTLALVPSPRTLPPENRVRIGRGRPFVAGAGGTRVVLWRQGPLFCALAGDMSEPDMTAFFRAVRPGIQVGG